MGCTVRVRITETAKFYLRGHLLELIHPRPALGTRHAPVGAASAAPKRPGGGVKLPEIREEKAGAREIKEGAREIKGGACEMGDECCGGTCEGAGGGGGGGWGGSLTKTIGSLQKMAIRTALGMSVCVCVGGGCMSALMHGRLVSWARRNRLQAGSGVLLLACTVTLAARRGRG